MDILLITIITMGTSLVMDKLATQKLYKTIADLGYKSNCRHIDDLPECIWRFSFIETIIPIYNVLNRMFIYLKLYNRQMIVFEFLKKHNLIRLMDTKERKIYESNPTGLNAIKMFKKEEKIREKIQSIYMTIDGKENKIYYQIVNKKMDIIKVEGPLEDKNLKKDEIEKLILSSWSILFTNALKLEGINFYKSLVEKEKYEIKHVSENDLDIEKLSVNYKYDELVKMYKYFDTKEKNKVKTLKK